jgi:hypothetical protein
MKNNQSRKNVEQREVHYIQNRSFNSQTEDSESSNQSRIKPFFDINSCNSNINHKGLVRFPNNSEDGNSFKLILNKVKDCKSDSYEALILNGANQLNLKKQISSPSPFIQRKGRNEIFEEVLKTPHKDSKPFIDLLLKKYQTPSISKKFNLSSDDCINNRNLLNNELAGINDIEDRNHFSMKNQVSFKFNFSTRKEEEEKFDFEPEDGESDLMYKAKINQNTLMQRDKTPFRIRLFNPPDRTPMYLPEIRKEINKDLMNKSQNEVINKKKSSKMLNIIADSSFSQHQQNFTMIKNELKKVYTDSCGMNPSNCKLGFLKRLMMCSKQNKKACEFEFIILLNKMNFRKQKHKFMNYYGLAHKLSILYSEFVVYLKSKIQEQSVNALVTFSSSCQFRKGQNASSNTPNDFEAELKCIDILTHETPNKFGLLSMIILTEFLFEFHKILPELQNFLLENNIKFSFVFLKIYGKSFAEFKSRFHLTFIDQHKFSGFKKFVFVSFFQCLRCLKNSWETVYNLEKVCGLIHSCIYENTNKIFRNFEQAQMCSLEVLLEELSKF